MQTFLSSIFLAYDWHARLCNHTHIKNGNCAEICEYGLQEPIAAGMACRLDAGPDDCQPAILVFDLGGGTFDVSLLQSFDGILEVVSSEGDTSLGGLDLDLLISEALVAHHLPAGAFAILDP